MIPSLQRAALHRAYRSGQLTPADVVAEVHRRIAARGDDGVWIHTVPREQALGAARALAERHAGGPLPPLFGLPFAVKDNIDVACLPTTAACPGYARVADRTATVVRRALDAGAILVGKTNLDQFATGLSGTRSPYGIVRNPYDPSVIAGGSSSGSAVAVAAGLVTFALGTDTAGSGRVPAGLTGTVGVKPSRGLVSTQGIVPACRSLDCASVFALSVADGAAALASIAGPDAADPYSRALPVPPADPVALDLGSQRIGVPARLDVAADFLGDRDAAAAFGAAVQRARDLGAQVVAVDLRPFLDVGRMLYDGPWLAERAAGVGGFLAQSPDAVHPVVREVLSGAVCVTGVDVFRGEHALAAARRSLATVWAGIDALLVPTVPTNPPVEALLADPVAGNAALGRFTTFANLLDLAGVAVPSAVDPRGVPIGVTLLAPAGRDTLLLGLAAAWQAGVDLPVSTRGDTLEPVAHQSPTGAPDPGDEVLLAVVGAHLEGEPLHADLLRLGARMHARTRTAPDYRLFALPRGERIPERPGLLRVAAGGRAVQAEVYRLPLASLGPLVAGIAPPLGIGSVVLADGSQVLGFLCEQAATAQVPDITDHGGWRPYRASLAAS